MIIPCPHCGERNSHEFTYYGDASVRRPDSDVQAEGPWVDYVYFRNNLTEQHEEWWHHTHGCRSWIKVTRNLTNHQIASAVYAESDATGASDS